MALTAELYGALRRGSLAFGGAPLGNLFAPLADADAIELVRHAWRRGVRYFDTAPHYGNGLSEQRIGAALHDVPRDSFLLSTKVGRVLVPDASAPRNQHGYVDGLPFAQMYDYSRDGVLRSLADSRRRLRQDRVDLVYAHDLDRATHGAEFERHFRTFLDSGLPVLADLKGAGVIGGFGIGVNGVAICLDTLRHADLDVILLAGRYTLLDQSALAELLPLCARRGTRIVAGGPFNSGILATGAHPANGQVGYFDYAPAPPDVVARVAALEDFCLARGVPLKAAALQFPLAHPAVACVLAGARSIAELDENLALAASALPAAFWHDLRARGLVVPDAPLAVAE
jgi:D-threo-aldose 1-dehydrogenase